MFYNALSRFEAEKGFNIQQSNVVPLNANYRLTAPRIEMLVGPWYVDEFGNAPQPILHNYRQNPSQREGDIRAREVRQSDHPVHPRR